MESNYTPLSKATHAEYLRFNMDFVNCCIENTTIQHNHLTITCKHFRTPLHQTVFDDIMSNFPFRLNAFTFDP